MQANKKEQKLEINLFIFAPLFFIYELAVLLKCTN